MTTCAALIIGIDGWEQYTRSLVQQVWTYEPLCNVVVIDNASVRPYPSLPYVQRTERLCYSAAINTAHRAAGPADWYLVLSNDVRCEGPFIEMLSQLPGNAISGPHLARNQGFVYLEGWCVAVPAAIWDVLGGWDENFHVSSWEDVDFSLTAMERGYMLLRARLPFVHLDQRQRFGLLPNYWESERHNMEYFARKHPQRIEVRETPL